MSEFTVNQAVVILYYLIAGAGFFVLFDIFTVTQKIFKSPKWLIILEDTAFWIIFILVVFTMNFNLTNGEIKGYAVIGLVAGAVIYFFMVRKFVGKGFIKRRNAYRVKRKKRKERKAAIAAKKQEYFEKYSGRYSPKQDGTVSKRSFRKYSGDMEVDTLKSRLNW